MFSFKWVNKRADFYITIITLMSQSHRAFSYDIRCLAIARSELGKCWWGRMQFSMKSNVNRVCSFLLTEACFNIGLYHFVAVINLLTIAFVSCSC